MLVVALFIAGGLVCEYAYARHKAKARKKMFKLNQQRRQSGIIN